MNVREENAARALIQGFLKDSVPEYIKDTGQEILNSGGVHKLTPRFRITATAMKRSWAFAVTWPPPP